MWHAIIFAVTFDENFSKTGVKVGMYNTLISIFTAITIVVGIKMMGQCLSSLIVFPSLTSMRIFKSFKSVTICSAILSVGILQLTYMFLRIFNTGRSFVVANLIMYIIFAIVAKSENNVVGGKQMDINRFLEELDRLFEEKI